MAVQTFVVPTRVISGNGAVAEIGPTLAAQDHKGVLVVTDQGIVNAGLLPPVTRSLQESGVAATVFAEVKADPEESIVEAVVAAYQAANCDGLLAVGGGSSLDVAKAAGVLITNGGTVADYDGFDAFSNDFAAALCRADNGGNRLGGYLCRGDYPAEPAIQDVHREHTTSAADSVSRSRDADHVATARSGAYGYGCAHPCCGGYDVAPIDFIQQCLQPPCDSSH